MWGISSFDKIPAMATVQAPITSEQRVLDALNAAGFRMNNGWFYPAGDPSRAVVRLSVFGGQYQVWRRRKLQAPWMLIATADVQDFDTDAFDVWRRSWPLAS